MADPTASINRNYSVEPGRLSRVIKNAEALTVGALLAHNYSNGKVEFADDAASLMPMGVLVGQKDGDNQHLTGDSSGTYSAVARGGIVLENVSVTGVSAITDIGKLVYATDGQTMTLTKPTTGMPWGMVVNWRTSTYCDVYLFSFVEGILLSMIPPKTRKKTLGYVTSGSLEGTSAIDLLMFVSDEHFTIDSLHATCQGYDAGAVAGSQTMNLEIAGTNTTGGVLTLAYTDCDAGGDLGVEIDATAITAANEVHIGDTVHLELVASGTGFTANQVALFEIYIMQTLLPGA